MVILIGENKVQEAVENGQRLKKSKNKFAYDWKIATNKVKL